MVLSVSVIFPFLDTTDWSVAVSVAVSSIYNYSYVSASASTALLALIYSYWTSIGQYHFGEPACAALVMGVYQETVTTVYFLTVTLTKLRPCAKKKYFSFDFRSQGETRSRISFLHMI